MKTLFTSVLLCLTANAFAQDVANTVQDSTDFDFRMYNTRVLRFMSVDPKASPQNNPYTFEQKFIIKDSTFVEHSKNKSKDD